MKIKVYSLLVSLVFIPVAILGQFLGLYLGKILYFIYDYVMSLRLPNFIADIGPTVVSEFLTLRELLLLHLHFLIVSFKSS